MGVKHNQFFLIQKSYKEEDSQSLQPDQGNVVSIQKSSEDKFLMDNDVIHINDLHFGTIWTVMDSLNILFT